MLSKTVIGSPACRRCCGHHHLIPARYFAELLQTHQAGSLLDSSGQRFLLLLLGFWLALTALQDAAHSG